jgi:PAS domain S-box-containing protein
MSGMEAPSASPLGFGSTVNVQAFGILLETLRDHAIPLESLTQGLSVEPGDLSARSGRVPWNDFALFVERFEKALGPGIYDTLAERFLRRREYGGFMRMMRLAVSPQMGFKGLNRWFGPHWFPIVENVLAWPHPNQAHMTLRIPEPYLDAPAFFQINRVAFEVTGRLLAGAPTPVRLELSPREAHYFIDLPPSRTLWAWLRRVRNYFVPDARLAEVLNQQQDDFRATLAALQESESRYRHLVEQSHSGIWRLDPVSSRLTFVSSVVKELLGYEPGELQNLDLEHYIEPEDMDLVTAMLAELAEGTADEGVVREVRHRHKAGHIVWCEVHAAPLRDDRGELLAIQGVTHDITARKEVQRERERAIAAERERDRAEGANRVKDSILASMSHEIRTPLTSQIGFTQLLLRDLKGTNHEKHLQVVERNSRRLLTLLDNMLELARLESDNVQPEKHVYPIAKTVREVMELLHLQAEGKNLSVSVTLPENLMVCSDPRRDEQVFLNVLGNAIRYTEKGAITVSGELCSGGADSEGWVEVRVSDTGVGIAPEFLPHVFDDFRQESEGSPERKGGTGLGLAIVRRLMASVGGRIAIESRKGAGSTVIMHFPSS